MSTNPNRAALCALVVLLGCATASAVAAAEFRDLGGGSTTAYAAAVSGDGTVVAGFSSDGSVGYRWTGTGGVETFGFQPTDASSDGSVIVGVRGAFEGVRWTQADGAVGLGDFTPNDGFVYSAALGVSADGSLVVGSTADEPFVWTSSGGMSKSPSVPVDAYNGFNTGVSGDGLITAGGYQIDVPAPPPWGFRTETHFFRAVGGDATEIFGISLGSSVSGISTDGSVIFGQDANKAAFWAAGNVTVVGVLPGMADAWSWFDGASASGDCLVGTSMNGAESAAMIWDDVNGLRKLSDVLVNDFGLGAALSGWTLKQANDVSDDCSTIAGTATNPDGARRAWVVTGFSKSGVQLNCAQPLSGGSSPKATDCLFILNAAVGLETCSPECVCAPKSSLPISATDAAICLAAAVGGSVSLDCPCAS
jgi:uncharacterized membrane protein